MLAVLCSWLQLTAMPARKLTAAEENAARSAYEELVKKGHLSQPQGRGRRHGMAPIAAALAMQSGTYNDRAKRTNRTVEQLAIDDFGATRAQIQVYLDLLGAPIQVAPSTGIAAALQTPAAARSRLAARLNRVELEYFGCC